MRSRFRDVGDAFALASVSLRRIVPENAGVERIAKELASLGLMRGLTLHELQQHLFELYQAHQYTGHLAVLSAVEGDVRDLAQKVIDGLQYSREARLRKILATYRVKGQPDRFRRLLEELFAGLDVRIQERACWFRLLDYRNWLAHGRIDVPPRNPPTQEALEREIERAQVILRTALKKVLKL